MLLRRTRNNISLNFGPCQKRDFKKKKITFARPGVSVFGALHCMSCSSCLLSAKILHMQIYMLHLGSSCMLVQQVRLPHSWPVNRTLIGAE